MEFDKIMAAGNLEDITGRLICCTALLHTVHESISASNQCVDALAGVCYLLEAISRDFQADIDAAEDYTTERGKALV